ncbi:MAG: penicillin-binding transpeptidase domain-containing protein [bacterium]|nr:penicillin-binding transpeptidase domain-containing protein [bacterium]
MPRNNVYDEYMYIQRKKDYSKSVINEEIQKDLLTVMKNHKVPYGVVLVADARNGRILAAEEHSERGYDKGEYINSPLAAASIFKIVTLGTAIGTGVFNARDEIKFYDRPYSELNKYMKKRKTRSYGVTTTVENAMALSNNSAFAEIGLKLNRKSLYEYAEKFLFSSSTLSGMKTGYIVKPKDSTELIQLCSGLKNSFMTPFQAMMIAMAVANDGELKVPYINNSDSRRSLNIIRKNVANGLLDAMSSTTVSGTSKKQFSQNPDIAKRTYAKTGSLYSKNPDGYYNWFVGIYDGTKSRYAVIVLTVNDPKWSVKANYIAYKAIEFVRKYEEN